MESLYIIHCGIHNTFKTSLFRIKEEQEEDQRRLAQELLGVTGGNQGRIDSMKPSTSQEFEEFCEALSEKIGEFKESEHYADFAQNLIKNISIDCK